MWPNCECATCGKPIYRRLHPLGFHRQRYCGECQVADNQEVGTMDIWADDFWVGVIKCDENGNMRGEGSRRGFKQELQQNSIVVSYCGDAAFEARVYDMVRSLGEDGMDKSLWIVEAYNLFDGWYPMIPEQPPFQNALGDDKRFLPTIYITKEGCEEAIETAYRNRLSTQCQYRAARYDRRE